MAYRLLLADDSITIQKVVELTLSEEDFVVTAVGDGAAGLETARKLMPDIILADVFMPKMDGYELCAKVKQEPGLKHIPVMLLAGTFENFDDARAGQAGADDHITKPFESAELISKVKNLVARSKAAPAEELEAVPVLDGAPIEGEPDKAALDSDDLWSVVSMASADQPLAKATETLTENDLWKRANLLSDADEPASFPQEEESIPWGGLTAEPVAEAEALEAVEYAAVMEDAPVFEDQDALPEVALDAEPDTDATAILNMDDLKPAYGWGREEPPAIELAAEAALPAEFTPFESLEQATQAVEFVPPPSQAAPARAAAEGISRDVIEQVAWEVVPALAEELLAKKVREAVLGMSREMIEKIVWEVVPDLAEEILAREIEKLKTGM